MGDYALGRTEYHRQYREKNRKKIRAREKLWREQNPDKAKASYREYYEKNKDEVKARAKKRIEADRDTHNKRCSKWAKENYDKTRAVTATRRSRKIQATPAWADTGKIREIYKLAKIKEQTEGGRWHVDHIVPLKSKFVCGLHCEANLTVIPKKENMIKGNRYWPDMWK